MAKDKTAPSANETIEINGQTFVKMDTTAKFISWEKVGMKLVAELVEIKGNVPSKLNKGTFETNWKIIALDGSTVVAGKEGEREVVQSGEEYALKELAVLANIKNSLTVGTVFMLVYTGEKKSTNFKGKMFKEFDVFVVGE